MLTQSILANVEGRLQKAVACFSLAPAPVRHVAGRLASTTDGRRRRSLHATMLPAVSLLLVVAAAIASADGYG